MAKKRLFDEDGNEVKGKMKKPFYKKWWFWLLVVIVVGGALGGGDDTESTDKNEVAETASSTVEKESKPEESVAESKPEVVEETYAITDTVNVGKVTYVVNSVDTATNVGGEYGQNSKGTYLLVNVTVTNNGDEALTVDNNLFKLLNDGKEYESDSMAGMYANEDTSFFLESVNPELSLTGNLVFDVSDNVINSLTKQLKVSTGFWGTETELINLQ
uniref:DUF4352 domain-containing protein n=1 Tax=Jeotgalibaca porci TaxID=1868793 RepID=UPI00359F3364